ncbi:MAG: hypothetical protein WBC73_21905 [Phormidesmis sp.]
MSENQSPKNSSEASAIPSQSSLDNTEGHTEDSPDCLPDNQSVEDGSSGDRTAEQIPLELNGTVEEAWEPVTLPGTLPVSPEGSPAKTAPSTEAAPSISDKRERELLALIHDLNECNDALLTRVAQLENDLEQAYATIEREVASAEALRAKTAQQMSAEQAAAHQVSQTAQQQVGKLVSEIETLEKAIARQRLVTENLQTEFVNSQERVTQLEHECALMAQQHAEAAKARVNAENTNRDLKSRLQRQQRYTLQFKAALEKSLTVSTRPNQAVTAAGYAQTAIAQTALSQNTAAFDNTLDSVAVTMPKAQRIMPWAAGASSFQGIDPHLETLIRNASKPASEKPSYEPERSSEPLRATDVTNSAPVAEPDAEDRLWQDLERVISGEPEGEKPRPVELAPSPAASSPATPQLNWQAEAKAVKATRNKKQTITDVAKEKIGELAPKIARSFAVATGQTPTANESASGFTEPSPWQKSPSKSASEPSFASLEPSKAQPSEVQPSKAQSSEAKPSESAAVISPSVVTAASPTAASPHHPSESHSSKAPAEDTSLAVETAVGSAVSPLVKPLRPQKKVGSLAAVKLPTFQNAKVASFRR